MKVTIWKFPIQTRGFGSAKFTVPLGAQPLTAQVQRDWLVAWFAVDPDAPKGEGVFHVIPTGETIELPPTAIYMGTSTMLGTHLVCHVFAEVP